MLSFRWTIPAGCPGPFCPSLAPGEAPGPRREAAHLHLTRQVLVLVPDDGQSRLLTQGVGAVSERLLWGRRRGGAADFLVAEAQTPLV